MTSTSSPFPAPVMVDSAPGYDFVQSLALLATDSGATRLPAESPWRRWVAETRQALDPPQRAHIRRWFGGQNALSSVYSLAAAGLPAERTPSALIATLAALPALEFTRLLLALTLPMMSHWTRRRSRAFRMTCPPRLHSLTAN